MIVVTDPVSGTSYIQREELGRGGFGVCYRATRCDSGELVALKWVSAGCLAGRPERGDRTAAELRLLSRLPPHPNLVKYHDSFSTESGVYQVLELCDGPSLFGLLQSSGGCLVEDVAAPLIHQLLLGCQFLHDRRLVHRDLKPGNLLLHNDCATLKISDLGLTCSVQRAWLERHTVCGTPNYLAPEVLYRLGHSMKSDLWAVGVIIYTIVFGNPPFENSELLVTYQMIIDVNFAIPGTCSTHLHDLISKLIVQDPNERPAVEDILNHPFLTECLERQSDSHSVSSISSRTSSRLHTLTRKLRNLLRSARMNSTQCSSSTSRHQLLPAPAPTSSTSRIISPSSAEIERLSAFLRNRVSWFCRCEHHVLWIHRWAELAPHGGLLFTFNTGEQGIVMPDGEICAVNSVNSEFWFWDKNQFIYHGDLQGERASSKYFQPILSELVRGISELESKVGSITRASESAAETGTVPRVVRWKRYKGNIAFQFHDSTVQLNLVNKMKIRVIGSNCIINSSNQYYRLPLTKWIQHVVQCGLFPAVASLLYTVSN